jgi:hypothetical protein
MVAKWVVAKAGWTVEWKVGELVAQWVVLSVATLVALMAG